MTNLEAQNASIDKKEDLLKGFRNNIKNLQKEIIEMNKGKDSTNKMPRIERVGKKNAQEAVKLFTTIHKPLLTMELDEEMEKFSGKLTTSEAKLLKENAIKLINRIYETLQKNPEYFCETKDSLWYVNEEKFSEYFDAILLQMFVENNEMRKISKKIDIR